MNEVTHIAIAKRSYELLPDVVRDFLDATEDEISFWAVFPDKLDKDNLDFGYWFHSRKMVKLKKGLVWKHGSVSLAIGSLYWQFRTYYRFGEFDLARSALFRLFHYCTDACTLPHLVFKEADFLHGPFERDMAKKVFMQVAEIKVHPMPLKHLRSVYDSATDLTKEIYSEQKEELIKIYTKGGNINQHKEFKMQILRYAVQACVDFCSHIYLSVSKEDNYLEEVKP